ncbi:ABC-2 type transport system permease protein [Parafrankia irregularis]|uniref:ABC-2 type transport system permease protein n=1 Tax=Parafrankia irregularis TaxID=795642 RepID=A0A0S4QFT8_9ACTN|nr:MULTISPECIES: ABC transporter permease [Parafrankia]MBE3203319.1 ABC transporter permease [Parafrankia sp. CH37]CUU54034.1 ABC-2 type transport system permease protein [Parafrankia irregularis]
MIESYLAAGGRGTYLRYVRSEIIRAMRNTRLVVFSLVMPILLFAAFSASDDGDTLGGLEIAPYIMISMATFGAMNAVLGSAGRIAVERSIGWNRQLRLTALTGSQYVFGKVATGFTTAVLPIVAVFAYGRATRGVELSAGTYLGAGASILLSLLPLGGFAVWLGYLVRPENLQAVAGGVFSLLALAGGIWVPIEQFPGWLADIVKELPMYWSAQAGRAVLEGGWVGWQGLGTLAIWSVVLAAVAGRAYARDQLRT